MHVVTKPSIRKQSLQKKFVAVVVAAAMAVGVGAALAMPAEAQDDRADRAERREQRMQNRAERLQQKVDDGVITQERADEILARRAQRAAARTERREALATTLGTTPDELKAQLRAGSTLAEIAEAAGVELDVVIDQLVAGKEARLDNAVATGRIDQATADERLEMMRQRITDRLNR